MNENDFLDIDSRSLFEKIQKENDYLKSIIQNNSFYIIKTDLEGKYTYLNPYFCKIFSLDAADWMGKESLSLIIPEDHQACMDLVMECFACPGESHWAVLRKPIGKGIISTQWEFKLLNNDQGIPSEVLCIGHDITSLIKRQEELMISNKELACRTKSLAESENRFRNMMETIPQIAWTNTSQGEVTFYNQRWYDYTGLDDVANNIWGWRKVIHPDDLQFTLDQFRSIRKKHNVVEFQIRFKSVEGDYRWHLSRLMPIKNGKEEVLWIGTATDIHELKLLQQQKDDFISIASHELKTPITSIKASIQILDKLIQPQSEKVKLFIDKAQWSIRKMQYLIDDLLNASKIEAGQLMLTKKSFNLSDLINESNCHIELAGKHTLIINGDTSVQIFADYDHLEQVINNFTNNAIKYAPDSKNIILSVEKYIDMVKVSVQDFGIGISAKKLPQLFKRYYRVEKSGVQYSGLGLGLYICEEIIKRHEGTIGVESELGKGSTFWFTLPLNIH